MLPDTGQIKKAARAVFKDNAVGSLTVSFGALTTVFIGAFIAYLLSLSTGLLGFLLFELLYIYCVILPVFLGAVRYFSILIEGKNALPVDMFYYFSSAKDYMRAFLLISSIFFRILGSIILAMIIPFILNILSNSDFYNAMNVNMPVWTPMLKTASVFLEILGIGLVILINIKYYLAVYLFTCDDNITVTKALRLSIIISRKTKVDFWILIFSMIGYILLSVTVLPLFFILPYFMLSYVVHGKCSAVQYNDSIDFAKRQFTVVAR